MAVKMQSVLQGRKTVLSCSHLFAKNREKTFFAITITRIFFHVRHAAVHELKTSLVISTDTDVVVLAISIFEKLAKDKLWIAFGKGKYRQWIPNSQKIVP
jgi:hypothetical protein